MDGLPRQVDEQRRWKRVVLRDGQHRPAVEVRGVGRVVQRAFIVPAVVGGVGLGPGEEAGVRVKTPGAAARRQPVSELRITGQG